MVSDSERQTYTYHISQDPPRPYHHGGKTINAVIEKALKPALTALPPPPATGEVGT
jgi:hypothetical protein